MWRQMVSGLDFKHYSPVAAVSHEAWGPRLLASSAPGLPPPPSDRFTLINRDVKALRIC